MPELYPQTASGPRPRMISRLAAASCVLLLSVATPARGQTPPACSTPPLNPAGKDTNILTAEQAAVLGELMTRQLAGELKLVRDPSLNAYVQRIADRMAELGGTGAVRVELLDLRALNAFALPGGRILVSRKLVSFARNEDELAGVLAHELGHVATRDAERTYSTWLRRSLNITSLGDARDVEEKYNLLVDNNARKPIDESPRKSEQEQQAADQFAVWLAARAGYQPQAFPDIWDRFNELQSKTGNWLTDLFGSTTPEAKRLRVTVRALGSLPAACRGTRATTEEQFAEWQRAVVSAARLTRPVSLPGLLSEKKIDPPLRSTLSRLRFSPDGRWVMAQDDGNVYVFAREGLAYSFQFASPDTYGAQFTPDSSAIVVYGEDYRVERWSLATRQREWVRDLVMSGGCLQSALSPDGLWMACATSGAIADLGLRVYEVATGAVAFEKRGFFRLDVGDYFVLVMATSAETNPQYFQMRFSPDARSLVVARGWSSVAVDLTTRREIPLPGAVRDRIGGSFAFLGNDRIVGIHLANREDSGIVTFPKGEVVARLNLERHAVAAATRSDAFVLVRDPSPPLAVAVFSVKDNKLTGGSRTPGFDMYDDVYLTELRAGEIAIQKAGANTAEAVAKVPTGPLARLRAADISPDLRVLAVSQTSRGLVWDMESGKRVLVRGFRGANVEGQQAYLDFPPEDKLPRAVLRMDPNAQKGETLVVVEAPKAPTAAAGAPVSAAASAPSPVKAAATVTASSVQQHGPFLVGFREAARKADGRDLVVFEANSGRELWKKPLGDSRGVYMAHARHDSLTLMWNYGIEAAKIVAATPALTRQFESLKARKNELVLLEVLDLRTGAVRADVLIDFGRDSFRPVTLVAAGDHIVIGDNANRTLVYSIETGKTLGHAFGSPLDVATGAPLVCVQNAPGEITVHSLPALERAGEFVFPSEVLFARFSPDGKRLFVLTGDQTAYTIDLAATTKS